MVFALMWQRLMAFAGDKDDVEQLRVSSILVSPFFL